MDPEATWTYTGMELALQSVGLISCRKHSSNHYQQPLPTFQSCSKQVKQGFFMKVVTQDAGYFIYMANSASYPPSPKVSQIKNHDLCLETSVSLVKLLIS